MENWKEIKMTTKEFAEFRSAYEQADKNGDENFTYNGDEWNTKFVYYWLQVYDQTQV